MNTRALPALVDEPDYERPARLADAFARTLPPRTQAEYRRDIIGCAHPLGECSHTDPARSHLPHAWLRWCQLTGTDPLRARRPHGGLWLAHLAARGDARSTQLRRLSAVSSWYGWLADEDIVEVNPAALRASRKPKVDRLHSPTIALSVQQADQLLAAADADGDLAAAVVAVLLFCGLRVDELVNANVEGMTFILGQRVLLITRKGGRQQWIPLPAPVTDRVDAHLADRAATVEQLPARRGAAGRPPRPLLAKPRANRDGGHRLSETWVWRLLRRLAVTGPAELAAVADQLHPHTLRHTAATLLLDAGVPLVEVQRLLGHQSPDTTIRYDHHADNPIDSPVHKLAEIIGRA